jgi:hypothetical protein
MGGVKPFGFDRGFVRDSPTDGFRVGSAIFGKKGKIDCRVSGGARTSGSAGSQKSGGERRFRDERLREAPSVGPSRSRAEREQILPSRGRISKRHRLFPVGFVLSPGNLFDEAHRTAKAGPDTMMPGFPRDGLDRD